MNNGDDIFFNQQSGTVSIHLWYKRESLEQWVSINIIFHKFSYFKIFPKHFSQICIIFELAVSNETWNIVSWRTFLKKSEK